MPLPQVITPFNVYFNAHLIFKKGEVWRLFTNFFFFGNLGEQCLPEYGLQLPCTCACPALQLVLPAAGLARNHTAVCLLCVYVCACAQGWTLCFTCFSL